MRTGFDHLDSGTPEADWQSSDLGSASRLSAPGPTDQLLVLAAHPDDETLGAGGLIAAAAAAGARMRVVVASDGEASHPHSPTHRPDHLAQVRRAELTAAMTALDPRIVPTFLGLPDGRLDEHLGTLTRYLASRLDGCTHLATPWVDDAHPDHEACARAAAGAVRGRTSIQHWQFPIWAWHWAGPADLPWARLRCLDLDPDGLARKQAALACHRSQHLPLSDSPGDEAVLPGHVLAHFTRAYETFVIDTADIAPAGDPAYFDQLYASADDPWGLAGTFYERRKQSVILATLPRPRFARAFEPGCATGALTDSLADRCDHLLAWDVAGAAVNQARDRLAARAHVTVEQHRIPQDWPEGQFDLIVLSEVAYYAEDLECLVRRVRSSLTPDGVLVACHWRHPAPDHPQTAGAVHRALGADLYRLVGHEEQDFLLDVWSGSPRSVARDAGLIA